MQRKIGLDYMRAAAILCVLVAHTAGQNPLGALGFIGVEIFFVLSGYLIGGILLDSYAKHDGKTSWPMLRNFWVRRWLRTVPNYFLFLPIYWVAERYGWRKELFLYATFTQNLAWPIRSLFSVSWSLTVEEWFYLLLPSVLATFLLIFRRFIPAMISTIGVMFLVPLLLRLTVCQGQPFDSAMRKVVIFRLDSLMWGVSLAAADRYRVAIFDWLCHPIWVTVGIVGLLLESWWVWARYQQQHTFPATLGGAFILTGVSFFAALLLPYCSRLAWKKTPLNRTIYLVSLWSYSIYLSHGLMIWISEDIFNDPQLGRSITVATAWVFTFAVSAAVYNLFEKPILRLRDRLT